MNTLLIFLCVFVCRSDYIDSFALTNRRSIQEENEERIVVKKLASMIHDDLEKQRRQQSLRGMFDYESSKAQSEPIYDSNMEYNPVFRDSQSFENKNQAVLDDDVSTKQPFAVAPLDYRFYEKDFSDSTEPLQAPPTVPEKPLSLSNKKNPKNETEEETIRRKLYAHLTLNPSFIPYGQVQAFRIPSSASYEDKNATQYLALTYGTVCAILVVTSLAAYVFCRKLRKNVKDAEDVDYPAYGVTGPSKDAPAPTGDRHLAHSAQMYHYQHQKQQIIAMEKNTSPMKIRKGTESGSEEDDMTVYECPGLAPVTGEMEVKNPMFQDEDEVKISNTSKESSNQKQTHLDVKKSSK